MRDENATERKEEDEAMLVCSCGSFHRKRCAGSRSTGCLQKPTGISRDRAKRCALKPTEVHKMPTDELASRQRVPTKAEKTRRKPS